MGMKGYTGLAESDDCRKLVNPQGYDSLIGTLRGKEPAGPTDDDVIYTGRVRRVTRIDYCNTKPGQSADQLVWCVARLTGSATMWAELTVYGDPGRGAYLHADSGSAQNVSVTGDCETSDMQEIRNSYPEGTTGGSPDGQPIAESSPPKFVQGGIPKLRDSSYFPAREPETAWGLRVIRSVP